MQRQGKGGGIVKGEESGDVGQKRKSKDKKLDKEGRILPKFIEERE